MPIRIAPVELKDLEVLLVLMAELQQDDPWQEPFNKDRLRRDLERLFAEPVYGLAFLAWEGGDPVGYLVLCFDYSLEYGGKGAWVDELFVRRPHRGNGIGTQLLDLAEDASRGAGATALHLEVNHGNPAKELYRRRGFAEHQRFLMTKQLSS